MGYKRKIYKLRWPEGHELHGLEISMRGMSMDDLGTVIGLQSSSASTPGPELIGPLIDVFARNVQAWNVEDEDGNPVPVTEANIRAEDSRMLLQVVMSWAEKATTVAPPLPPTSSAGNPSLEGTIPMAVL
jgi:hypothetical protein